MHNYQGLIQLIKEFKNRINRNGSLTIEPNEWKNYFLLTPIDNIDDLLYHWQHSTVIFKNLIRMLYHIT